jgi:hypothetical protein
MLRIIQTGLHVLAPDSTELFRNKVVVAQFSDLETYFPHFWTTLIYLPQRRRERRELKTNGFLAHPPARVGPKTGGPPIP